jgi:chromosome segregation ATPase
VGKTVRSRKPATVAERSDIPEAGGAATGRTTDETIRDLERMNQELLVRIKELELRRADGLSVGQAGEGDSFEVSKGSSGFAAMVKDLDGEIDAVYMLKKALEGDLLATRQKLAEEETLRAELQTRVQLLEAKSALADQLREDVSFVEEEQNKTHRLLKEATSELERITEERDGLAEEKSVHVARIMELQRERLDLEAQILGLKERLAEMVLWFSRKEKPPSP